jgi:hypothetical protein
MGFGVSVRYILVMFLDKNTYLLSMAIESPRLGSWEEPEA